jgi:hypothetical protein
MSTDRFHRDASQRLTFELSRAPYCNYRAICEDVCQKFGLQSTGSLIEGTAGSVDASFQDFRKDNLTISLEWDNWTGFTVVATHPESEQLVHEIGEYLQQSKWASGD